MPGVSQKASTSDGPKCFLKAFQNVFDPQRFASKGAMRSYWAEFTGMFFFLFVSVGTACSAFKTVSEFSGALVGALKKNEVKEAEAALASQGFNAAPDNSMTLLIAFAFGMSIMVLVYSVGHISGGHFNPAVTFATLLWGQINLIKGIMYVAAQLAGSACGVLAVKGLWPSKYSEGLSYGLTSPDPDLNLAQAVFLECMGTACLLFVVYGTAVDPRGARIVSHMAPLAIGFTVFLAHLLLVPATGCGINPARSFGSAIVSGKWSNQWIYWVGPMLGGPLGAAFHYFPLQWGVVSDSSARAVNIAGADDKTKKRLKKEAAKAAAAAEAAQRAADEAAKAAEEAAEKAMAAGVSDVPTPTA